MNTSADCASKISLSVTLLSTCRTTALRTERNNRLNQGSRSQKEQAGSKLNVGTWNNFLRG